MDPQPQYQAERARCAGYGLVTKSSSKITNRSKSKRKRKRKLMQSGGISDEDALNRPFVFTLGVNNPNERAISSATRTPPAPSIITFRGGRYWFQLGKRTPQRAAVLRQHISIAELHISKARAPGSYAWRDPDLSSESVSYGGAGTSTPVPAAIVHCSGS